LRVRVWMRVTYTGREGGVVFYFSVLLSSYSIPRISVRIVIPIIELLGVAMVRLPWTQIYQYWSLSHDRHDTSHVLLASVETVTFVILSGSNLIILVHGTSSDVQLLSSISQIVALFRCEVSMFRPIEL
jgi:hypothetical protein